MNYRLEPDKLEFVTDKRFEVIIDDMLNCKDIEGLEKKCTYGQTYVATLFQIDMLNYDEFENLHNSLFNLKWRLRNDIRRKELNEK